ncbi:MAG: SDR family oxidoreductase, partial [Chloroflexota bacterium]
IARALVEAGNEVITLTRRVDHGDPLAVDIKAVALDFGRPAELAEALQGVDTLFNTYWIRFPRGTASFERAIAETNVLLAAARQAGVRRIVHVSVVGADQDGPTPYVRAKGVVEYAVKTSGLEWSIVRPTLTYGPDDILVNNMAWALRRLPVYGMPGDGHYPIQPVHVDDVARICIELANGEPGQIVDAAGPDQLPFRQMVEIVRSAVGSRSLVVPMPTWAVLGAARLLGLLVRDVVLTRHEVFELSTGFLTSIQPPRGEVRFEGWVREHADGLGRRWSSELARNYPVA